jgi:hypothetical protein
MMSPGQCVSACGLVRAFLNWSEERRANCVQIRSAFWSEHQVSVGTDSDQSRLEIGFISAMQSEMTVFDGARRVLA